MYFINLKFKLFVKPKKKIEYMKAIISIGNFIKYAILFTKCSYAFKYFQLWKSSSVFSRA